MTPAAEVNHPYLSKYVQAIIPARPIPLPVQQINSVLMLELH
jgi:hypothetical protein